MRRAFILIPVLIFSLAASVVPCGAQLFGVPDDVPARRIIVPFFDIEVDGTDDFLIVLVNTFNKDIDLHLVLYDRDTSHVYNDTRTMTAGDVELIGVRDLTLGPIPSGALSRLVVEENGKSYYRGEIFIDVQDPVLEPGESDPFVNNQGNVLLGYIYRIDVAQGTLSECNALHVQKGATSVIERFEYIETDPETAEGSHQELHFRFRRPGTFHRQCARRDRRLDSDGTASTSRSHPSSHGQFIRVRLSVLHSQHRKFRSISDCLE